MQACLLTHGWRGSWLRSPGKKTPSWLTKMVPYGVLFLSQWINQNLNPTKIATYPNSSRPSDHYIKPLHPRLGVMNKAYLLALRNSLIICCFLSLVSSLSCAFFAKRAFIFLRFLISLRSCPIWTIDSCDTNLCWNVQSYNLHVTSPLTKEMTNSIVLENIKSFGHKSTNFFCCLAKKTK